MYFSDFPLVRYPYYIGDTKEYALARNVLRRVAFSDQINSAAAFVEYSIKDGETAEDIANRIYGNSGYHWIILLANNVIDPYHGWCMSQNTIEQYISRKYSGVCVYFTDSDNKFLYNSEFADGSTLTQNNTQSAITQYRETFCEFRTESPNFQQGSAVVSVPSGLTQSVYVHRVMPAYLGLNYFSVDRPTGDADGANGAQIKPIADPLTKQTADYEAYGAVVGTQIPQNGLNGALGATVEFWESYIGAYMGVSGDQISNFATTNRQYEYDENENKRTIKILSPVYLNQALKELKSALGV